MADEIRTGVYICSGCGIGSSVDCDKLAEGVKKQTAVCRVDSALCSENTIKAIQQDIEENKLNRIVIGGCSPRFMSEVFRFDNGILLERVNLREHVAWSHTPKDEETELLALDYLKMGLAKIKNMNAPEPFIIDINDTVLVVGGGVTGMNAALSSAKAGYKSVIVEKADELGGFYRKLYKITPREAPYLEMKPNQCEELVSEVEAHPNIEVLTSAEIQTISGQPGAFEVTVNVKGEEKTFQAGAIIQATGFRPYNPNKLSHLGYGKFANVVTNTEMEEMAKNDRLKAPYSKGDIKTIVFVQCAGSRDPEHLPYCSSVCCMTSLKQALYVREKYPNSKIYVIYKDMRTPAQYEKFYKSVQNEDNIFLTKGDIYSINEDTDGSINVYVKDTLIGDKIKINADLVVLATGIVPTTLVEAKEDESAQEETATTTADGKKMAAGAETGAGILNLTYRQGTDLPTLHYGFPDSHYICFPYETRRTGIYAAGMVRSPMDIVTSTNDALGASLKAIQVIESVRKGVAVHPRAGDAAYAEFFLQRCTQCKRCTEECPFGTLDEDTKGTPKPNPNRCRKCGICMGACPERIVSFKSYSVPMISAMIKSIDMPESDEEKPRILAFMCENDAYPSLDIAGGKKIQFSPNFRIIPVRCLGSVNSVWVADALSMGFDGVMMVGCKHGDDYQCHFIKGSELANKRMENVQEKLKQLVLEPERVEIHALSIDEYERLPILMNKFAETIDEIGPNPYKDM